MKLRIISRATLIGAVAQVAMVVAGHYVPAITGLFMWGGLGFSLIAGVIYVRMARGGWIDSLAGGLIVGGLCALIGIWVSVLLGDAPLSLMLFGTAGSAVTGLIGGALGKLIR